MCPYHQVTLLLDILYRHTVSRGLEQGDGLCLLQPRLQVHLIPVNFDVINVRPRHALEAQPRDVVEGSLFHLGRHLPLVLQHGPVAQLHLQRGGADDSEDASCVLICRVRQLILVLGDVLREEARREAQVAQDSG